MARRGGPKRDMSRPSCVVCGGRVIVSRRSSGEVMFGQTCCIECSAFVVAHPELTDRSRTDHVLDRSPRGRRTTVTHRKVIDAKLEFFDGVEWATQRLLNSVKHVSVEEWFKRIPSLDVLLDDVEDTDNPWARSSRLVVALYLEAAPLEELPGPSLLFEVPKGKRVRKWIVDELFGGEPTPHWDLLLAWRCRCIGDHRVIYRGLDDFPFSPGYHDPCPRCGCAPVEVIRV